MSYMQSTALFEMGLVANTAKPGNKFEHLQAGQTDLNWNIKWAIEPQTIPKGGKTVYD